MSVPMRLQFEAESTWVQSSASVALSVNLSLPIGASELARQILRHTPPRPLEIEQAIELVEEAIMPARARLPEMLQLQTADPRLRRLVAEVRPANLEQASAPLWLDTDAVENLFNRLVARAEGRPAPEDSLPVDGESAARLVIVREILHHWRLAGLQIIS